MKQGIKFSLAFFFLFCVLITRAQDIRKENYGFSAGLYFEIGTHIQAIGFNMKTYVNYEYAQLNITQGFKYNLGSYGKRKLFFESRSALGLAIMWGKKENISDFIIDGLNHQTERNYAIAYNYLFYFDNKKTSQLSGGWALHLKSFSLFFENDIFGGQARDRFRSGHFLLAYKTKNYQFLLGSYIWTGETRGSLWTKPGKPGAPNGFRDLSSLPYGTTSHGILYGGLIKNTMFGNAITFKMGMDSEQFRHFFQNRLSHDLFFLPKKMERNTPHYPRLNEAGLPIFTKSERRKDHFYYQQGLNINLLE